MNWANENRGRIFASGLEINRLVMLFTIIAMAYGNSGCATVLGYSNQRVRLQSSPNGTDVTITDPFGMTIFNGRTPTSVSLPTTIGGAFSAPRFTVSFAKNGYATETRPIIGAFNGGWYIVGNLFSFSWIGWLVDALTGAMWILPASISVSLFPSSSTETSTEGALQNAYSSHTPTQQNIATPTAKDSLLISPLTNEEASLDPHKPMTVDREPRFDSRELQANLVYPDELREQGRNGYSGYVQALVLVSSEGKVKKILVETPDDRRFSLSALHALKQLAFLPAEIGTKPVPYWASIILVFRLR